MLATAEGVGIFLKALNDGSLFDEGEQDIYSEIFSNDHTGLIPSYQSIAQYHKNIDNVVIQFTNPTNKIWKNVRNKLTTRFMELSW
ncbi:MAG: hypothetical protein RLO17_09570 [Cyclobacteriaceae bacterium]